MSSSNASSGGPPLRAIAMVLIAFAIMFATLGVFSLSGSNDHPTNAAVSSSATSSAASIASTAATGPVPTWSSAAPPAPPPPPHSVAPPVSTAPAVAGPVDKSVPVRVLNNSVINGLASRVATKLRNEGWTSVSAGNYGFGAIASTTVYYTDAPGEKAAADTIAGDLGATSQPRFAGIQSAAPGVIVIVTSE